MEQATMPQHRTFPAVVVCLALIVVGVVVFNSAFAWPTGQMGRPPSEGEIWLYDVLPLLPVGYLIGLVGMAVTRLLFPRSSINVVLLVMSGCAGLASLFILYLAVVIGGSWNVRDLGTVAMFIAIVLGGATWGAVRLARSP